MDKKISWKWFLKLMNISNKSLNIKKKSKCFLTTDEYENIQDETEIANEATHSLLSFQQWVHWTSKLWSLFGKKIQEAKMDNSTPSWNNFFCYKKKKTGELP